MPDGHLGRKRTAIAADPDLLAGLAGFFASMGADIVTAVSSTSNSPLLASVPTARVVVGDLQDVEDSAAVAEADLLVTHAHGRQASERLGIPLLRVGFPIFDRLGTMHRCTVGYRGTRNLIFEVANIVLSVCMNMRRRISPMPVPLSRRPVMLAQRLQLVEDREVAASGPRLRIAIATQDLKSLNAHFGSAKRLRSMM